MAVTAQSIRNMIPIPKIKNQRTAVLVGFALFLAAAVILYDAYDGRGKQGPWPVSTLFPW